MSPGARRKRREVEDRGAMGEDEENGGLGNKKTTGKKKRNIRK